MNYIDPLTGEPDNSWAQKFTTQQLINSHNHLVSVGMANSRAVRLMRNEINLRARIAAKLRARGVALDNFDPYELRDWHGRWTTDDKAADSRTNGPSQTYKLVPGEQFLGTEADYIASHPGDPLYFSPEKLKASEAEKLASYKAIEKKLMKVEDFINHVTQIEKAGELAKAIVGDVAAGMRADPDFSGNIPAFFKGEEMPMDVALRDAALEQKVRGEVPVATVMGRISAGLAESAPMVPLLGGLPAAMRTAALVGFTADMAVKTPGIARQLGEEYGKPPDQRDPDKIDRLVAKAIQTVCFTVAGGVRLKRSLTPVEPPPKIPLQWREIQRTSPKPESEAGQQTDAPSPSRAAQNADPELTQPKKLKRVSQIDRAAFDSEREAYWKAEAKNHPENYSPENLNRMKQGKAPIGSDGYPMELHHKDRTPQGGVRRMTRTDHRLGENYKKNHP